MIWVKGFVAEFPRSRISMRAELFKGMHNKKISSSFTETEKK
jgi:hypothetical protein